MRQFFLIFFLIFSTTCLGPTTLQVNTYIPSDSLITTYDGTGSNPGVLRDLNYIYPNLQCGDYFYAGPFWGDYAMYLDYTSIGYNYLVTITYTIILFDSNGNGAVNFMANQITYSSTQYQAAVDVGADICYESGNEFQVTYTHNLLSRDRFIYFSWFSFGTTPVKTTTRGKKAAATTNYLQGWGLSDITVTIGYCVEFCQVCYDNTRCVQCINGYYHYRHEDYDECKLCPMSDPFCTFDQTTGIYVFQRKMNGTGWTGNEGYTVVGGASVQANTPYGRINGYYTSLYSLQRTYNSLPKHATIDFSVDLIARGIWYQDTDYFYVETSGSIKIITFTFQQTTSTATKRWSLTGNISNTATSLFIKIYAVLPSGGTWGVGNVTLSIDSCQDPNCITCETAYISKTCPVAWYLRKDSNDYTVCAQCPNTEDGHRYFELKELTATGDFNPATTGFTTNLNYAPNNATSSKWFCNGSQFFGPFTRNDYLYKQYPDLPLHFRWKISIDLFRLDNWTGNFFYLRNGISSSSPLLYSGFFYENMTNVTDNFNITSDFLCQDYLNISFLDSIVPIESNWTYTKSDPSIRMHSTLTPESWVLASYGVSNLVLTAEICADSNCLGCDNSTHCSQCDTGLYQSGFRCYKTCPVGTYTDDVERRCQNCIVGCDTCTNSTNCFLCTLGFAWNGVKCIPECQPGYWVYNTTRSCQPCPSRCITCAAPNRCFECTDTSYYSFGYCLGYCPEGYYKNETSMTCGECPKPCFGCGSPNATNCTSCFFGQYLLNTSCVEDCKPYGLVNDLLRRRCGVCFSGCELCLGVGFDECTKCNSSLFLYAGQCIPACPAGFYPNPDPSNRTCEPCDPSCYNCTGPNPNQCTYCNETFLYNSECIGECLDGFYGNTTNFTCMDCPSTCATCTWPDNCQTCKPNSYLQNQFCNLTCLGSTFPNTQTWTCDSCDPLCLTCRDASPNSCTSCYTGTYLFNDTCTEMCPIKYFKGDKVCVACPSACKSCYATDDCDACEDDFILDTGRCLVNNCTKPCRTCNGDGPDNCLSCDVGQYLQGSICLDSCARGYVPTSTLINVCIKCTEGCSVCAPGDFLIGDKCAATCPAGMEGALLEGVQICITISRAPSISVIRAPVSPVYLSTDLTVQVDISATGGTPLVWWDTNGVPKPKKDQLFNGLNLNTSTLVIPKANLVSNTSYTLIVYGAIDTDVGSYSFRFNTVPDINEGDFRVFPAEGQYLTTNFTVELKQWFHTGFTLYFDVYTYYQVYDPLPQQFLQQGYTALAIGLENNLNSPTQLKFQIPPANDNRTQYIQVVARSESQSVTLTNSIRVYPMSLADLKVVVENMDPSTLKKPTDIMNFGSAILKVYDLSDSEKEATTAAVKVVENYAKLSNNPDFCLDDILCHSHGTCNVTNNLRFCTCKAGYSGQYCEFNETTVLAAKGKITLLIDVIVNYPIDNTTAGLVISCLQILTIQPTFVEIADLQRMLTRAQAIAQTDFVDKKIGSGLIEAMSNLFKAVSSNPTFRSSALSDILRLIDSASDIISSKLAIGESARTVTDEMENQAMSANNLLDDVDETGSGSTSGGGLRMLLRKVSSRRVPRRKVTAKKIKKTVAMTSSRGSKFRVPPISFQAKTSVTFAMQEFKSNQRDATNAGTMASSTTSLSIKDGSNPVTIDGLKTPIVIEIPKLSPTDPKKVKSNFKCSYYDRNTNRFRSDGCEKIGETTDVIICACTHLTEFGSLIEIDVNAAPPQINLNNLFKAQETQLATRARNPFTLKYFQNKYEAYIKYIYREEEPLSYVALFILAPIILIFFAWFIRAKVKPIIIKNSKNAKLSSIAEIIALKSTIKDSKKHIPGMTAGALFSAMTTTAESVKFPKHIRILCFYALMCSMMAFSAGIGYVLSELDILSDAANRFTKKFTIFFAGIVVIPLANLAYDFFLGIIFYCLIARIPELDSDDRRRVLRIRCLQYFVTLTTILGCIGGTHMIVMMNGNVANYFPYIWLVACIIDFLIVDLAWWVLAFTCQSRWFRCLLMARGFFIENFEDFKYDPARDGEEEKMDSETEIQNNAMDVSIMDEGKSKIIEAPGSIADDKPPIRLNLTNDFSRSNSRLLSAKFESKTPKADTERTPFAAGTPGKSAFRDASFMK